MTNTLDNHALLSAKNAELTSFKVFLGNDGEAWVRTYDTDTPWAYATGSGFVNWDRKASLPEQYEPYVAVKDGTAKILRNAAKRSGIPQVFHNGR